MVSSGRLWRFLSLFCAAAVQASPLSHVLARSLSKRQTCSSPPSAGPMPSSTEAPLPPASTQAPPSATSAPAPVPTGSYNNPIKPGSGADPWMLKVNNTYYMTYSSGDGVHVFVSNDIATGWPEDGIQVYSAAPGEQDFWAPELHYINGQFYVYVSIDDGNNANHRMHVLQGTSATDPTQPFNMIGKIGTTDDNWSIDGTVLEYQPNGKMYFVWSGWSDANSPLNQNLYIAEMDTPTSLTGDRVLLHSPTPSWQQSQLGSNLQGVNEGPSALFNNGRTFVIYSAAGSWSDDYYLAMMGIDGGADPMVASNLWALDDRPVFWKSDTVFGPGHASFTEDRNGVPYIVYHADATSGAGWGGRTIRTQTFGWNPDSSPAFPSPAGFNVSFPMPA